jgi:mitochondrial enoyl-[acyl-carrier protein] reductase / trans-2-enoyl-CoA reductase
MPKVALHTRFGEPGEVLQMLDLPAEQPGPNEVVVKMEAAAMHIADLRTITGAADFRLPLPRTPGFEGIGHVLRVGAEVQTFKVGDRVFPGLGSGTFREEVRCAAEACMPAPQGDAVQLSLLTVNGPTAAVLLEDFAELQAGDWVIQNAANSSCGRYLVRLAGLCGVRTVNVVRRPEMLAELQALGGDVVLLDGPDLAQRVERAVAGAPVRLGIDAVGGAATQRIAECLAPGSNVVSYGSMSQQPCHLDFYLMFRRDIRLLGLSFARQFQAHRSTEQVRALYARLAALMASGVLVAKIAEVYPLERLVEACERAGRTGAERDGKVVIGFQP